MRQARELLRLAQEEFAGEVGINRQRLASYEEGRAALRFDLALRICRQFIISEKWLATGKGDMRLVMDLTGEGAVLHVPADSSFGKAYDDYLAPRYEAIYRQQGDNLRINLKPGDPQTFYRNLFLMLLEKWRAMLSAEEMTTLFSDLVNIGLDIVTWRVREGTLPALTRVQGENGELGYAAVDGLAASRMTAPPDQAAQNAPVRKLTPEQRSAIKKILDAPPSPAPKAGARHVVSPKR